MATNNPKPPKDTLKVVETIAHFGDTRMLIPTAELQPVVTEQHQKPIPVTYERSPGDLQEEKEARNRDLDPQLVWRGKDEQDWTDLVVQAPPIYIQEKVHPKVLIDDLMRRSKANDPTETQYDLFGDFNGIPEGADKTDFYQHDSNWTNRMILGDSLQVMASLAEREGLRGKVQCIYFDPPYGIKFNSNFQWSTTSRDVKDGNRDHITREPEMVKAFRDTWRDGIHSYLTYLRDRLTVARDLLTESGSIFVQIGDENVHRVKSVLDEVFGDQNFIAQINVKKTGGVGAEYLDTVFDYVLWFAKDSERTKYRGLITKKVIGEGRGTGMRYDQVRFADLSERSLGRAEREDEDAVSQLVEKGAVFYQLTSLNSESSSQATTIEFTFQGATFFRTNWKTGRLGLERLHRADRVRQGDKTLRYRRELNDFPGTHVANYWDDTGVAGKIYVVQTAPTVIQRCVMMTSDPGDLVLDPTCGSGTTATVSEQWGRRWITVDTSRVALALARARIMGARYPFYLLADSKEGQQKEGEVTRKAPSTKETFGNIRHGFVYERVPHITLKSIANNAEIDVIWEKYEEKLSTIRTLLGQASGEWKDNEGNPRTPEEWEIPRTPPPDSPLSTLHSPLITAFWSARIARQKEIDASIAAKADHEFLYDKPYVDNKKVRVAGPFTVESLSPHRMLAVGADDELIDPLADKNLNSEERDFVQMILDSLKTAGVQQAHKEDKIEFMSLSPWPGYLICAEGTYQEADKLKRAAIFIGPEFGTVMRPDLVSAAREAAGFQPRIIGPKVEPATCSVSISTMHAAKGLEFRAVAVMACDDEVIPLQERIEQVTDDSDLEEVYNTERHLLYVACTRARDHLLVTSTNPASEFLDDMVAQ